MSKNHETPDDPVSRASRWLFEEDGEESWYLRIVAFGFALVGIVGWAAVWEWVRIYALGMPI